MPYCLYDVIIPLPFETVLRSLCCQSCASRDTMDYVEPCLLCASVSVERAGKALAILNFFGKDVGSRKSPVNAASHTGWAAGMTLKVGTFHVIRCVRRTCDIHCASVGTRTRTHGQTETHTHTHTHARTCGFRICCGWRDARTACADAARVLVWERLLLVVRPPVAICLTSLTL